MKLPTPIVDIRLSITDPQLIVNIIPYSLTHILPHCEVLELDHVPFDCQAWINVFERKQPRREY